LRANCLPSTTAWLVRCLVIMSLLSTVSAEADDYYVSPSGRDSNPGTKAKPWQTIGKVNATALQPGDRVLFQGSKTFPGTITLDSKHSGSAAANVELSSYGRGRATIDGGNANGLLAKGCSHLLVRNLGFVGSGRKTGNTTSGVDILNGDGIEIDNVDVSGFQHSGLAVRGVHNSRITHVHAHDNGADGIAVGSGEPEERWSENVYIGHCVAENNPGDPSILENHSGSGIVVGGVRGCLVEYCEAMNNGWDMPWTGNGPVGIWAWNADKVTIQFCVSHDNKSTGWDGGGFDLDGGVTNSILQYNYSYNNIGPGYFLCQYPTASAWKNNIVRYNISVNDAYKNNVGAAIEVYGGDERMSDAEVYNNTVYNERSGAVAFGGLPAPRVRFRNNILVATGELIKGDAAPSRFEDNCYWLLGADGVIAAGQKTLEDWIAATGQEKDGDTIMGRYADPLLVDAGAMPHIPPAKLRTLNAYRIEPGSPCIGAGIPIEGSGGRDFSGYKLPKGRKPSLGACQAPARLRR